MDEEPVVLIWSDDYDITAPAKPGCSHPDFSSGVYSGSVTRIPTTPPETEEERNERIWSELQKAARI